ncbi:MAG: ABC transporter substrate-binding protein [Nocardia sp.]|nr:ABC transporter substrate-binding protein [Nocardia sp.]
MKHSLFRSAVVPLAVLLTTGWVTGCGGSSSTSATTVSAAPQASGQGPQVNLADVTLTVGDQAGVGSQALLSAAGLADKLPFKVKWADFAAGPVMLQAEASGSVDIGSVGDAPPAFTAAGGAPIAVVSAVRNPAGYEAIVVPKDSPITSVAQLRGKKIAGNQGSNTNYFTFQVLNQVGLKPSDVNLDYLAPAAGLAAVTSGAVDAWAAWSPYIEQATELHGARVLTDTAQYGTHYSYNVASKRALADPAKAAAIREYVRVWNQARLWANAHPDQWADYWSKATGLPPSVIGPSARDTASIPVPITKEVVDSEQQLVSTFATNGLIPKKYDFSPYVFTGLNTLYNG